MDQLPRSNDGFANNNMFADSQQYNAYDNLFQPGTDQNSYDASWGLNASAYPGQSRVPPTPTQAWPSNANHLSTASTHAGLNGQASPYGRSLSPSGYGQTHFNDFAAQQNFQYRQPQYDPTLVPSNPYPHGFNYAAPDYQTPNPGTIAPQALEHESRPPTFNRSPYGAAAADYPMSNTNQARPMKSYVADTVDQHALSGAIPSGKPAGHFSIINFDQLAKGTKSERMGNFVNIGSEPQNWDVNRAALPAFVPRKSRSELRKIVGNDQKALSKIGKKSVKKDKSQTSTAKQLQLASSATSPSLEKIKYDGDSSSQEESSSDEDSDTSYTSDEATEPSPLPAKRPTSPREATEYDATKALWRGKRKNLSSDSIRKGIVDFWDIIKTIRDRWKADAKAVEDAEEKKRENELPLLESRVRDQRDMMESAFKAALKHGHRSIVELYVYPFLCFVFLAQVLHVHSTGRYFCLLRAWHGKSGIYDGTVVRFCWRAWSFVSIMSTRGNESVVDHVHPRQDSALSVVIASSRTTWKRARIIYMRYYWAMQLSATSLNIFMPRCGISFQQCVSRI